MKSFRKDGSCKESEKKKKEKNQGKITRLITRLKRTGKNNTQEMATVTIVFIHIRNSIRTLTEKVRKKAAILREV